MVRIFVAVPAKDQIITENRQPVPLPGRIFRRFMEYNIKARVVRHEASRPAGRAATHPEILIRFQYDTIPRFKTRTLFFEREGSG